MSQYTNLRYSITLNDAQLDYLSDEQQDILRMKCLKTFIRMAVLEETKVSGKNYLWGCDRKTATRIVHEFNQLGILRSESSNRTTIHTLICLSVWFSGWRMIKSSFFDSKPMVTPIVKPSRTTKRVPPEKPVETRKSGGAIPANLGGTQ